MEKQLRKKQNMLGISGIAVIVFGIWNIAKMVIYSISTPDGLSKLLGVSGNGPAENAARAILLGILIFIALIDIGLRLLVGLSARAESKGKKKSIGYLIVAIFLALGSVISIFMTFGSFFANSVFDTVISILVELTSLLVLCDVIVSSFGIRSLKKKMAAEP